MTIHLKFFKPIGLHDRTVYDRVLDQKHASKITYTVDTTLERMHFVTVKNVCSI